jgi:hypothetical protein
MYSVASRTSAGTTCPASEDARARPFGLLEALVAEALLDLHGKPYGTGFRSNVYALARMSENN